MPNSFPRIITLLRKEKKLSQKSAAAQLGISQALLSHYEKGIRECGLNFLVRTADFYGVSTDYLLGRSPDRSGAQLTADDLPEPDSSQNDKKFSGSILPTLNKKLISNSVAIIFDKLQSCGCKALTEEISAFLSLAVYRAFRMIYGANPKNPDAVFSAPPALYRALADAAMEISESKACVLAKGGTLGNQNGLDKAPEMPTESLLAEYPQLASSLLNLIKNAESRLNQQ